jgi:hypothetical protein
MLGINQPRQQAQLLGSNFSPSKICFVVVRGSNLNGALSHQETQLVTATCRVSLKGNKVMPAFADLRNTPATEWIHTGVVQS